jgi:hypothetical protein
MIKAVLVKAVLTLGGRSLSLFSLVGQCMMKGRIWLLLLLPAFAAVAALVLFVAQRGFGGGHGDFDPAIGLLGLPSILFVAHLPIHGPDMLLIVLLPAALNLVVWAIVIFAPRFCFVDAKPSNQSHQPTSLTINEQ